MSGRAVASLPMYDWPEVRWASDAFWKAVRSRLSAAGIAAPSELDRTRPSNEIWADPGLVISQTCGWPYVSRLAGRVRLVATPIYDAQGCSGPLYSSAIIGRTGGGEGLAAFAGRRAAVNGRDSMSGYIALLDSARAAGLQADEFQWVETGSHRDSIRAVSEGRADFAAIDAVCWAFAAEYETSAVSGLRVVEWTKLRPGLPFITSASRSDAELAAIRLGISAALESTEIADACEALHLRGISPLSDEDYLPLRSLAA